MTRTGVGFVFGVMIRAALLSTLLAVLQLWLGLIATATIGLALHDPTL